MTTDKVETWKTFPDLENLKFGAGFRENNGGEMSTEADLKRCPFCGGEPEVLAHEISPGNNCHIQCATCKAYGPRSEYREGAAPVWNQRVAPSVSDGVSSPGSEYSQTFPASLEADKVDQEIAREAAESEVAELVEEASYLDFDGGEQHERTDIIERLSRRFLAAIQKAKAPLESYIEEYKRMLSEADKRNSESYAEKAEHAHDTFVMADIVRLRDENKALVAQLAEAEKERDAYKVAHADKMEELVRTLEIKASLVAACKAKDEALKMFRDNRLGAYDACCRALAIQPDSSAPKKADLGEKDA